MKKNLMNLSDVDGSIVKGSLVLDFLGYVAPENSIYQAWKMDEKNESLIVACANEFREWLKGKSVKTVDKLASRFMKQKININKEYYKLPLMLLQDGNEVVFLSGSPSFLVDKLMTALYNETEYKYFLNKQYSQGTIYEVKNNKYTGAIEKPMYNKEAKMKEIKELSTDFSFYKGIGDTASDLPILINSEEKILVDASDLTKQFYDEKNIKYIEVKA